MTAAIPRTVAETFGIRRLGVADAGLYRALMLEGYGLHPDAFTASVAERGSLSIDWWEGRLAERDDADQLVIGAWQAGRLFGVSGLRVDTRPKTRHKATLFGMYVQTDDTRRGAGRRLVEAVLDEARRRRGVRVVQLTVTDGNRAAQTLYEECGFRAFGVEPLAITTEHGYAGKVHMWIDLLPTDRRDHRPMAGGAAVFDA